MSAWFRFTSLMICLLIPAIACFTVFAQSIDIPNALRLKKLDNYSHIAAIAIYHWNTPSEVSNENIIAMLTSPVCRMTRKVKA